MNGARIPLVALDCLPDGPLADAIEAALQNSLPAIHGMDEAHTPEERLACYQRETDFQRASFVELYGEPFGWERRASPREDAVAQIMSRAKAVSFAS